MKDSIEVIIPVKDANDVTLQELMVGILTWHHNKQVKLVDDIITIYVFPDGQENISFLYEVEK